MEQKRTLQGRGILNNNKKWSKKIQKKYDENENAQITSLLAKKMTICTLDSKELNFHLKKIKAWKGKQIFLHHTLAQVIKVFIVLKEEMGRRNDQEKWNLGISEKENTYIIETSQNVLL